MSISKKPGWRCRVCTFCGRCFADNDAGAKERNVSWNGERCDVCVGCGKCAERWGLVASDDADAESGPTNWADAFKVMDTGFAGTAPPVIAAPGASRVDETDKVDDGGEAGGHDGKNEGLQSVEVISEEGCDGTTGATPGVAKACSELGLDDMESLQVRLGINPPGM